MPQDRRAFEQLPDYLKTTQNNREFWIADDPLYEPERADFVIGWVGDTSVLSEEDLERTPPLPAPTPERQRYQLSIGSTYIDPASQQRLSGAFYQDLVGQIEANGGIVGDDPNRVFETRFYSWAPPMDFDKHINFGRYFWTGAGAADVNGEFVTKEPAGSRTVLYEWTGTVFKVRVCQLVNGLPVVAVAGDYAEDASLNTRRIFRYNGTQWVGVDFISIALAPEDTSELEAGDHFYVARTGPDFNRPIIWRYTQESGRWHPLSVVVRTDQPDFIREGMLWEDSSIGTERTFKRFENGFWVPLTYTVSDVGPTGIGQDDEYVYDIRDYDSIGNDWSDRNWWRHIEDLSPADREVLKPEDQATRPIIEFWHGLEQVAGDVRDERNDSPEFTKYAFDPNLLDIVDTTESTTIYEYKRGTGQDDFVLGFPLSFNQSGEFQFTLTLESDTSTYEGYKFVKDTITGLVHSVWHKSMTLLMQEQDENGFFDLPKSMTSNPDHVTLTEISRSRYLRHFGSIIESQENFSGSEFGPNSWRWSRKDPALGATIIDNEQSLLRALALLQTTQFNLPDAIRQIEKEYNRILFKFGNSLNQMWNENTFNAPDDTLSVSAEDACDAVLTRLFLGRTPDFPFYYSDMGTYVQKRIFNGSTVDVLDPEPQPIFIPPSAPRVGTAKTYEPVKFIDRDGNARLRGHDGSLRDAFNDDRDLVWLELENRFFNAVPVDQRTETDTFSGRFLSSNFFLQDYFGNYVPTTSIQPVDLVVEDYREILTPAANVRVFSTFQGEYATYAGGTGTLSSGGTWLTRKALTDDVFLNSADGEYYIFNGMGTYVIERWNRPFEFDYTDNEFKRVIRREFERWAITAGLDFMENSTFVEGDPFTWNYGSAGIEGHYKGQYRRLYNTVRPHSHAWEVVGYSIEPTWWRTEYVPDSTAADGTPRYGSAHPMWVDFQAGIINPITGTVRDDFKLVAPVPVDTTGELLDPIAAGVVNESALDKQRIDDTWVYGDGAPVEEEFFDSVYYPFTVALASYLMKNGIWTDTVWTEVFIEIGLNAPNQVFNAPHLVHRQTLTRPSLADLPVHLETDDDGNTVQRVGVNAWVSEVVQINGGSVDASFGSLLRNTQPALSWRCSGYINGDRTIVRTLSGKEVPFEDVHVVLHQSQPVRESFASGVLITRESPGYRVYGYDTFNPMFTAEVPAVPVVGGQVVLTEETLALEDQHVFSTENVTLPVTTAPAVDTAGFAVMINGIPIKKQHIKINSKTEYEIEPIVRVSEGDIVSVQVITTQSNPSTQTKTFYTSQGVAFPYYGKGTGEFVNVEYGRFFGSSIDVVNFLIGYGRYLIAEGWEFPDASPDGADQLDYFYVAKLFAEWVVDVESPWNRNPRTPPEDRGVFQASPFAQKAVFNSPVGQTLNVEAIQNGAYGLVNQYGNPIPTDETVVSRVGPIMTVEAVADSQIYGVRALVTEIEHVVFFSNVTQFNDLMYDPPSAQAHETLRIDTYRSSDWNGRLEADGFIINGGELLPNFEKQAKDSIKLYDRYDVVDDPEKYRQAKNLYGWYPADEYMDPIDADERSRLDYYRGMIKAKGSRRAFKAYWRGTRLGTDNIFLYEEWAWLLARFGDPRRAEPQFRVSKNDFRKEVQVVRFVEEDNDQNTILEVVPFNRNLDPVDGTPTDIINGTGNGRWIRPPIIDDDNDGVVNIQFPTVGGVPDPNTKFYAKLFDEPTLFNIQDYFHYDPALEKYEPTAMANVDYITIADPARYNNGPDAIFSGGRIWTEDRVGDLWWNVRRNTYALYRGLLPDYENAASQWGRLEFFNAIIERTDEVATLTTLDPFTPYLSDGTPNPVEHGLVIGQKIDIVGSQPEDYNQEQIEVAYETVSVTGTTMANTNSAIGTIDFTTTEASGATDAPTFQAGDGCIVETRSGTQSIVLETGGILDDVIREINTILTLDEVQASNINGKLGFINTPANQGSWFTLREDAYIIGCTPTLVVAANTGILEDIEFIQGGGDAAGGAYVGVNVDNATNIIDDLRVVQNIAGDTIVEATCSGGHFLVLGDEVTISGATPGGYNGTFIVDQQVGDTTFQFKNAAAFGLGPATGSITYTVGDPSDERMAQNIVIAINRQTTDFFAEYLGTNTFRFCTMLPRATAAATTATFTSNGTAEETSVTTNDASTLTQGAGLPAGDYWEIYSAADATRYYVWYNVSDALVAEQTQVVCDDASTLTQDTGGGTVPGDYWLINSANDVTNYYVWYNVTDATTPNSDPAPGGTGIEIQVLAADLAANVAQKTAAAIALLADFSATDATGTATVTNATFGPATDASDNNTGFTVTTPVDGTGEPNSDPAPAGYDVGIEVQVLPTDLADAVAATTDAMLVATGDFNVSTAANVMTITTVVGSNTSDAVDTNTGFVITIIDGAGEVVVTEPISSDFTLSQPETEYIDLLTTRAGFTLGATADPDVVEATYPFDKTLVGSIGTQSGTTPFALSTATDWSLDGVVDFINDLGIVEVEAFAANGFLTIQNTEDYPGTSFLLDGDFFTAAGIDTSFLYGDFPPDSGMVFQVGNKSVEFVSTGGTLDTVVTQMNSFFLAETIVTIEAINDENRLTIRNTENFQGSGFTIQQPITAAISIPDLISIAVGPYSPDATKIVYSVNGSPDTPATGVPQVIVGFIDLYEWVRSPVPPSEWVDYTASLTAPDAPNGTPLNVDSASYVTVDNILSTGAVETTYYFWVEKNSGTNPTKDYTTEELRLRMKSPTIVGIPWFSPVDASTMVVYTANQKVVDGNAIEVIFDTREFETHFEWSLYAEGSLFKEATQEIIDKIIDSMSGVNQQGDTVPDTKLAASERYGSLFVPIQTVFQDAESAKDVWLGAINRIFRRRNFAAEERLDSIFRVDGSGDPTETYWNKAYFVEEEYEDVAVFDTVPNQTNRDERTLEGFYAVGDIVQLDTTENADTEFRDLWDPTEFVGARYRYDGNSVWTVVGIEDYTVELNDTLFEDVDEFRIIYYAGYSVLETGEKNDLIMTVLYEMLRQNNPCEWFFKTSYIQSQMFQDIFASPFVRPNEFDAVIANIQDVKPYRTKLRSDQVTTTLREIEDVPVNIFEFPEKKITLTFDRLNCNPAEDGGWDGFPWDLEPLGYDTPIWDMEDLGRAEFYLVEEIVADALLKEWTVYPAAAPSLYETRLELYLNGDLVEEENWPTTVTATSSPNSILVQTGVVLPVGYTISVYLSWGFVEGSEPTLGDDLEDTEFQVTQSTYEHHVARRIGFDTPAFRFSYARTKVFSGDGATTLFIPGMEVDQVNGFVDVIVIGADGNAVKQTFGVDFTIPTPGQITFTVAPPAPPVGWEAGNIYCYLTCNPSVENNIETIPQERVQTTVLDSVSICVKTFNTEAYGMWDHAPWDTTPWDSPPAEVGPKSFFILVGNEEVISPGIEVVQTSDDVVAVDAPFVFAPSDRFGILAVYVQTGGVGPFNLVTEGVDYDFYQDFDHIIEFVPSFGLATTDVVRLVYGRWFVGKLGSFQITSTPIPLDYDNQNMIATVEPPANDTLTIEYIFNRRGTQPVSALSGVENVVAEMVPDIAIYNNSGPQTFDETAFVGMKVIDTTLNQIFVYNTTGTFTSTMAVPVGYTFLVTRTQEIWQFDGATYNKLFEVGDTAPTPPVLSWPLFGIGVTHGPYYLGTAPGADVQWPEAKQIMDAVGECTEFVSPDYGTPDDL